MKNAPILATPTALTAAPASGNTEALLDSLIAECHAIIREVALPAAVAAQDDTDRRRYLTCIMELARTGAAVGEAVAKLRTGFEARQKITVERVASYPPLPARGV